MNTGSIASLLLFVHTDSLADFVHPLFELVDAAEGKQIGGPHSDDTKADKCGKGCRCDIGVLKTKNAKNGSADAKKQDYPPEGEPYSLVVEAVHGNDNALDKHPHRKDDRKRECQEDVVPEEDNADDNLKDGTQHPASAVGKERLGLEGKDIFVPSHLYLANNFSQILPTISGLYPQKVVSRI